MIPSLTADEWALMLSSNTDYFKNKPSFLAALKTSFADNSPNFILLAIQLFNVNPNLYDANDFSLLLKITLRGLDQGILLPFYTLEPATQNLVKKGVLDLYNTVSDLETRRAAVKQKVDTCWAPMRTAGQILKISAPEEKSMNALGMCCLSPCLLLGIVISLAVSLLIAIVGIIPAIAGAVIEHKQLAPVNAQIRRIETTYGKTAEDICRHYNDLNGQGFFASVGESEMNSETARPSESSPLLPSNSVAYSTPN